jgi:hypothetical protein
MDKLNQIKGELHKDSSEAAPVHPGGNFED